MTRLLRPVALGTLVALALAGPGTAGPDKVQFPANWKDGVRYLTVDRHDIKQHRELYASSQAAVEAMKAGRPLPDGTVLTLVQYKAQVDATGAPVRDSGGRFVKGDFVAYTVMHKKAGFGTEYPPELRNGDWEYAVFNAEGKLNEKANYKACFECHKPHEKMDYVISMAAVRGVAMSTMAAPKPDVTIANFAFGPNKHSATVGQPVTWVNNDDSPHQVTVLKTKERSPIITKGQSAVLPFNTPGTYEYICGLHPQMKGTIEVK
jgi:plastocyanin